MPGADALRDWTEMHVPLRVTIRGNVYTIPPVSMETGFLLRLVKSQDKLTAEDAEAKLDANWHERLIGRAVLDQMEADGVPWLAMDRVAKTALADHLHGRLAALQVWDVAADPKGWAELLEATRRILQADAAA